MNGGFFLGSLHLHLTLVRVLHETSKQAPDYSFALGSYPFSETNFQDFSRTFPELRLIFQGSKIHINPYTHKISMLILLTIFHTLHNFLVEFNRFPELSRTSAIFPGLSSPGKCHNNIPGLSRFSRTRTNLVCSCLHSFPDFDSGN